MSALACLNTGRPELVFTPDTLPEAQISVPYQVEIRISQNETPVGGFEISEGNLPKGLTFEFLDEDNARIYGIPEETGTFTFKTSVWCYGTNTSGQSAEKEYTIEVK
jgi:hypothetical protein